MNIDMSRFQVRKLEVTVREPRPGDEDLGREALVKTHVRNVDTGRDIEVYFVEMTPVQALRDPRYLRSLILRALTHEVDECLFVDGVRVTDPHPGRS